MERSKRSQSAAVRWALELAIDGATPEVVGAGVPQHAPSCPDLPRELLKLRNEPKSVQPRGAVVRPGASAGSSPAAPKNAARPKGVAAPKTCPELPRNAPTCPTNRAKMQNGPNLLPSRSAGATGTSGAGRTDVHVDRHPSPASPQDAPSRPTQRSLAQNEPNSANAPPGANPDPALSPRQLAAIVLLFSGRSYSDVVRQLKVDRKTLFRWRRSAPFIAEINRRYLATTQPRNRRDPRQQQWWRETFGKAVMSSAREGVRS